MTNINSYLHTSVDDAKGSLEGHLRDHPKTAAEISITLLKSLKGRGSQKSRRKMLASVLRKAARAIASEPEPTAAGPASNDMLANIGIKDARAMLEHKADEDPAAAARQALDTLLSLQGEPDQESRRRMLATMIGKCGKALSEAAS